MSEHPPATDVPTVRVGGIDIGSNTTRLIIADIHRTAEGELHHTPIARQTTITRLAEGVDARGILLPVSLARTRNALVSYRQQLRESGAVYALATATSAVRDADNGEAFLGEIEHDFGFTTLLLSGQDEARMTWAGVTSDAATAQLANTGSGLLLDIGGGSTEIVLTHGGAIVDEQSLQLGSVRLTEKAAAPDPPSSSDCDGMVAYARHLVAKRFPTPAVPDLALGVAGTVTTVAMLHLELAHWDPEQVHGSIITSAAVQEVFTRLSALPEHERALVAGLEPERAPVILGGIAILIAVLDHFSIEHMRVSVRDILDGIALRSGELALETGATELPETAGRTSC